MKGLGFRTILLGVVILLLVVSVALIGFTMLRVTTEATSFWNARKYFLVTPTVMNVMAMALLAVLIITG